MSFADPQYYKFMDQRLGIVLKSENRKISKSRTNNTFYNPLRTRMSLQPQPACQNTPTITRRYLHTQEEDEETEKRRTIIIIRRRK